MRSPWLLVALCVQAAISAAQTLRSSGTPPLEYRVDHVNTGPTPLQFSRAIGVSLSGLAANGALPGESGPTTLTFPSFFYSDQTTDDTVNASSSSRSDANDSQPAGKLSVKTSEPTQADTHVHWFAANREALLTTGVWHIFNLWTEAGTRDALYGPWFRDWMRSVSELRGWSDSDEFMAPYASHPIGGSIFGYIFRRNDPKYRDVQWGDGGDYFISILRSMGYIAVWHTQWKIGPISEASIGDVMLHASPGFITLVDTPTLGAVTMIAEDAADRYVIMGLENRTANRALLVTARCFLNPGRSFANVMAFKRQWTRDTRMGLFGENFVKRQEMLYDYKYNGGPKPFEFVRRPNDSGDIDPNHVYPKAAPIELSAYPNYEHFSGRNCIGGGGSGAARLSDELQIVAEVNGCLIMGFSKYTQSGDSLFYGAGPRWTPMATHRWSPFAELLFGGRKVTYEVDNPELEKSEMCFRRLLCSMIYGPSWSLPTPGLSAARAVAECMLTL